MQPFVPASSAHLRVIALTTLILAVALVRFLPHPMNFTPIGAMALFGGACFADRRLALGLPLLALALGDLAVGFHILLPVVYASFAINALLGRWLRSRRTVAGIAAVTLAGSLQFFVVTNFGCWWCFYPRTTHGLVACYLAALPLLFNTILGDLIYVTVLFGGLALAERGFPVLREEPVRA